MTLKHPLEIDAHLVSTGLIEAPNGFPVMNGVVRIDLLDDRTRGLLRTFLNKAQFNGRSGHARIGIDTELTDLKSVEINRRHADFPIQLASLGGSKNDRLLSIIKDLAAGNGSRFDIGRILMVDNEYALSKVEVEEAKRKGHIGFSDQATISEDGSVELPLEELFHLVISENMLSFRNRCEDVLYNGKHALTGIQGPSGHALPSSINPQQFLVGGMRLATGYTAILDRETSDSNVYHLAARVLDAWRTTGIQTIRELELFNKGNGPVNLRQLRVKVRFFNSNNQDKFKKYGSMVYKGVDFRDVIHVEDQGDKILGITQEISSNRGQGGAYARMVGPGRSLDVPWESFPPAQAELTRELAARMISKRPGHTRTGDGIPNSVRFIADAAGDVGLDQRASKVFISHSFPSPEVMNALIEQGMGVFFAHDLRQAADAFDLESSANGTDYTNGFNDVNFTGDLYEAFLRMEKRGAKLFMLYNRLVDDSGTKGQKETKIIGPHVREFHKGFWVRPEARKALDKVETVMAMYGSHVNGIDEALKPGLTSFLKRMKDLFDDKFAITHGKGPGVMQLADDIAAEEGIFRIGVGINLENKARQKPNYTPPAMVDFLDTDRLPRQRIMDDISTFKIFNIGGAGTLEEAAITLCSQKLNKNIITPIIFVDPASIGGDHLFADMEKQIRKMAKANTINIEEAGVAIENVKLLSAHAAKFCHFVKSYEEVGEIIEAFVKNPKAYYEEIGLNQNSLNVSIENAKATRERTGFNMPSWFDSNMELAA